LPAAEEIADILKVAEYHLAGAVDASEWEPTMLLLLVYLALMVTGDFVAYFIGFLVERPHLVGLVLERPSSNASLAIFLAAYFFNLWVAWQIAVRLTRPKVAL
jgi:hypothetical protein